MKYTLISFAFLNIYGPNFDNPAFFKRLFSLIPNLSQTNIIIGGDFNCVLDPYIDRSSIKRAPASNSRDFINTFKSNSSWIDVWWYFHPTGREYSFHSHVHNTYTRIDYFLVDARLLPHISNPKYHEILISDHPHTFDLYLRELQIPFPLWRMDPQLFTDSDFCDYLRLQIKMFLEINDSPDRGETG